MLLMLMLQPLPTLLVLVLVLAHRLVSREAVHESEGLREGAVRALGAR